MNLLDFPNEILDTIYRQLDIQSKGRLRKTCHSLHQTFVNPKAILTPEIVKKWDQSYQKILGLEILNRLYQGKNVVISTPTNRYQMMFFLYSVSEKEKQLLFSLDYSGYYYLNELKTLIPDLEFESRTQPAHPNGDDNGIYGVLQFKNKQNIEENIDFHCHFLYELVMLLVCKPQRKSKTRVARYQYTELIRNPITFDRLRNYSFIKCFQNSTFPPQVASPVAFPIASPVACPIASQVFSPIETQIQSLIKGCMNDVLPHHISIQETFEFYKRCKM